MDSLRLYALASQQVTSGVRIVGTLSCGLGLGGLRGGEGCKLTQQKKRVRAQQL